MNPTESGVYYQAMLNRDRRFDGRFYAAVTTTGVYCRPICPAPKPKFEHVHFYPSAAGAERDGFRPCRRCRPETSPGTPVWAGTATAVNRALRLIALGMSDEEGLAALAGKVGLGERQLRRLFLKHLGAPPLAIALTRRLDFARRLIDQTRLPMSEVAFAAGFSSIRRFNDAIKRRFGRPPGELRQAAGTGPGEAAVPSIILRLPYRPPLDWAAVLRYLRARAIPGVETADETGYARTIDLAGTRGWLAVRPSSLDGELELRLQVTGTAGLLIVVERIRQLFDLDADPLLIAACLGRDQALAPLAAAFPGLRVPGAWDGFELAVRTIIGQQVSVTGATTIAGRLAARFGQPLPGPLPAGLSRLFPPPAVLAGADLAGLGMPGIRARAIQNLAQRVVSGTLALDGTRPASETMDCLRAIPGIGPWTCQYLALRALREPDAFPGTDLGLRRSLAGLNPPGPSPPDLASRAESWRPWRAYAAMLLWWSGGSLHERQN